MSSTKERRLVLSHKVTNYRPISLLNSESKLFERIVFKYLYNHLHRNNLLSSMQSGSRRAQILHTRLRTNCSSLNLDLFHRSISASPLCHCGSIEDSQHFFFHCRTYQAQRTELLNTIALYMNPYTCCYTVTLLLVWKQTLKYSNAYINT